MNLQLPQDVEAKLKALFEQATGGKAVPKTIERQPKPETETMYQPPEPEADKLAFILRFDPTLENKAGKQDIQEALSRVELIKNVFHGLKHLPPLPRLLEALQAAATSLAENDLLKQDIKMIAQWKGFSVLQKETAHETMMRSFGPVISTRTNEPVTLEYSLTDANTAERVKENLMKRAGAIRAKIVEIASKASFLTDAQKKELETLHINIIDVQHGHGTSLIVRFGFPNEKAPGAGPNGELPMRGSAALSALMEHAPAPNQPSAGHVVLRHAMVFAGENWQDVFPQMAGRHEVKQLLEDRLPRIEDGALKTAMGNFLAHDTFLPREAREKRWSHPGADFKISSPDSRYETYRVRFTLPDGMSADDIYKSILEAPVQQMQAEAKKEELPMVAEVPSVQPAQEPVPVTESAPLPAQQTEQAEKPSAAEPGFMGKVMPRGSALDALKQEAAAKMASPSMQPAG